MWKLYIYIYMCVCVCLCVPINICLFGQNICIKRASKYSPSNLDLRSNKSCKFFPLKMCTYLCVVRFTVNAVVCAILFVICIMGMKKAFAFVLCSQRHLLSSNI